MKINTKEFIKKLNGQEAKSSEGKFLTMGEAISDILIANRDGVKMKLFVLAQKFYSDSEVDVDASDFEVIRKAVETTEIYGNVLVTGQILVMLSKVKETK